jgi:histidyl-tRNA synthetase
VWFSTPEGEQVKDIRSGDQVAADASAWLPPAEDLRPGLVRAEA